MVAYSLTMAKRTTGLETLDEVKPKKAASTVKVVTLPGVTEGSPEAEKFPSLVEFADEGIVAAYVRSAKALKDAKATLEQIEPYLKANGVEHVFKTNADETNPKARISSVRFADPLEDGVVAVSPDTVMVTVQDSYPAFDREQVEATLAGMTTVEGEPAKVDNYLDWEVVADFDTSVFNGSNGKFDKARYDAFVEAIQKVADKLKVENPLSCGKKRIVKDDFHSRRLVDFTVEDNLALQAVLPAKTLCKL